jgi:hypothetical protein
VKELLSGLHICNDPTIRAAGLSEVRNVSQIAERAAMSACLR